MEEQKKRRWLIPAALAAVLIAVIAGGAWFFATRPAIPDPYAAACAALDGAPALPDPVTLGVLGQGEVSGVRFGVSGNLKAQAGADGLALRLTEFTLADEDGSMDIEVYINRDHAALCLPGMLGEEWYGADLTEELWTQAEEALGAELAEWYFDAEEVAKAQEEADELREALAEVDGLRFAAEREALKALLANAAAAVEKEEDGFLLTFDQFEPSETVSAPVTLRLDGSKRLAALEFGLAAGGGTCRLDLGDPEEPAPRLELSWGAEGENSLELALTVAEGEALAAPAYQSVFALPARLAAGE